MKHKHIYQPPCIEVFHFEQLCDVNQGMNIGVSGSAADEDEIVGNAKRGHFIDCEEDTSLPDYDSYEKLWGGK